MGWGWWWGRVSFFLVKRATEMTPKLVQTPLNVIIIYEGYVSMHYGQPLLTVLQDWNSLVAFC